MDAQVHESLTKGFQREDPQNNTSKCVSKSKCASINCLKEHAKCVDLEEGEKGYDISGNKDMGVGYSCVQKCHEVGFDHFNAYTDVGDKTQFGDIVNNQMSPKSLYDQTK